ncbi:MAG: family 43 glycosylhydrolase [Lachnospiraceae bacterium]|nr:family 43 glycosylhydrolase [Lachnospiraceae bacterium]
MKKQVFNPYLPSYEYIPDGEPRVFNGRLYIYGSHDRFNGDVYCQNDYVCWSAPEDDLSDWRYEGVIFKKVQDPRNADGSHALWAPDVCRGLDGKYYLYYCLDFLKEIGVAVCDEPAGKYEFLGFVRWPDGRVLGTDNDIRQFDPGIFIDDDERIYLFSGNSPRYADMPNLDKNSQKMELERDMLTIKSAPLVNLPIITDAPGTEYADHPFFEASSVRKINGKYYFIYSSTWMHELCWAVADTPLGEYRFGGVLVSNSDIGVNGNTEAMNYRGNTHGSVAFVNGKWYVFYHRQTNRHFFSRQACAEEICFDGEKFYQAEMTSCGLNGGPLCDMGTYEARIACHLFSKNGTTESLLEQQDENHPAFTQEGEDREDNPNQYINNMRDGATAGFKYFDFKTASKISIKIRGTGNGEMVVRDALNGKVVSVIKTESSDEWKSFESALSVEAGKHSLYFTYQGEGYIDFVEFTLS